MILNSKNKSNISLALKIIAFLPIFAIFFWAVIFFKDNLPLMIAYLIMLIFIVVGSVLRWIQCRFWQNNIENLIYIKDNTVFVQTLTKTYQFRMKDFRVGMKGNMLGVWLGDTSKKCYISRLSIGEKHFNILLTQLNAIR